jgi:hypothetical protein
MKRSELKQLVQEVIEEAATPKQKLKIITPKVDGKKIKELKSNYIREVLTALNIVLDQLSQAAPGLFKYKILKTPNGGKLKIMPGVLHDKTPEYLEDTYGLQPNQFHDLADALNSKIMALGKSLGLEIDQTNADYISEGETEEYDLIF